MYQCSAGLSIGPDPLEGRAELRGRANKGAHLAELGPWPTMDEAQQYEFSGADLARRHSSGDCQISIIIFACIIYLRQHLAPFR